MFMDKHLFALFVVNLCGEQHITAVVQLYQSAHHVVIYLTVMNVVG